MPNKENAIKFLEYLASRQAQEYSAKGNYEFPVIVGRGKCKFDPQRPFVCFN